MTAGLKTIIYPVSDLAQAKKIFGALLGVAPSVDEAYYVHFNVAEQEIGLLPNGHTTGMTGPVGYWWVGNIEESVKLLLDAGAVTEQEINDVGGGRLIARVKDADGNTIGLLQNP